MSIELSLEFPDQSNVIVSYGNVKSGALDFKNPLTAQDRKELRWYLEVYGAHSLGDPDDQEAKRIAAKLETWGEALFNAVFGDRAAQRPFNAFQDAGDKARLLTINAESPAILGLPWELLCDPGRGGAFLFNEHPRISIRRGVSGATGGRTPFVVKSKERLHMLFIVSRPEDVPFLDPRADPAPVLDALETHAPGRVTWEFLRPPTLDALVTRIDDRRKQAVDILHFDGHGVFDTDGGLPERLSNRTVNIAQVLSGQMRKDLIVEASAKSPPNIGYLLFEKADGQPDLVSSEKLGFNLHRRNVPLVILSACQSAAQGDNEEPLGSVAARLTAAGIPAVLAMTHSVLVHTTRALFGEFYAQLAGHRAIGEALDAARLHLLNHPEKYKVQRGPDRVPLRLYDWFVPSLYQAGADVPLIREAKGKKRVSGAALVEPRSNVPARPEAGFFGRKRELWDIERWFMGKARRITITGFGGQGKTGLALEAARWLTRTKMFEAAVFVDYSRVQAADALSVAVSNIGSVLGQSVIDANAAREALQQTPTLVVLDNLEAVAAVPLRELLDAAKGWFEAGPSRVLLTTRTPDFGHPDYRVEGTLIHRRIVLDGLGNKEASDDALEWFAELSKLPPAPTLPTPTREALIDLFDKVRFHPLSIRTLAAQLKTWRPAELGDRLGQLLAGSASGSPTARSTEATLPELVASLKLSLDRLDAAARQVLPRLGVFQGGAFETELLAITGLEDAEGGGTNVWPDLRRQLEAAALIEAETVPGVKPPFLRFHPTLAPMLWEQLGPDERARLTTAHRQGYYELASGLNFADDKNPHETRAIASRELPNLLHAADAAFDAHDPDAVSFADSLTKFLNVFGLKRDAERLTARAQAASGDEGSPAWYLAQSQRGEQLWASGQATEAAQVFEAILSRLGDAPSYERAVTLDRFGRCFRAGGRLDLAAARYREGLEVTEKLEQSDWVKGLTYSLHTDLADVLCDRGQYAEARQEYETGLRIAEELGNLRNQGVTLGQLGTLAMREGKLEEAQARHRAALALFQQLREPAMEAVVWHLLGLVYQKAMQWDEAEWHYREAARIQGERGNITGAAQTWNQLANISKAAGKPKAAEDWCRKAIEARRKIEEPKELALYLNNLANLLQTQPDRLAEARQLAEEALALKKTLDPGAAEIWKTYGILAEIADREAGLTTNTRRQAELQAEAREHRRLAREALRNFPGARQELQGLLPLIDATLMAVQDSAQQENPDAILKVYSDAGWNKIVDAVRRIVGGERDPVALGLDSDLDPGSSLIVGIILAALSNPFTLSDLLPPNDGPKVAS
ncbi:MAG: tetratricopeptide repeat protein [Isosphaeraceae bacterium]